MLLSPFFKYFMEWEALREMRLLLIHELKRKNMEGYIGFMPEPALECCCRGQK